MSKELEARLDALESRLAIDALIANYAEAFDTMNEELLATLWHPDSRLLLGANGDAEGLDAILAQARVNMRRMPHMHHWMANALNRKLRDCRCRPANRFARPASAHAMAVPSGPRHSGAIR